MVSVKITEKIEKGLKKRKRVKEAIKIAKEAVKEAIQKFGPPGKKIIIQVTENPIKTYFELVKEKKDRERRQMEASMFEEIETFAFYEKGETPRIIIDITSVDPKKERILKGLIVHEFLHIIDKYKGIDDKIVGGITEHANLIWEQIPRLNKLELDITSDEWARVLLTVIANLILIIKDLTVDDFLVKKGFEKEVFLCKKDVLGKKWKYTKKMRRYRGEKVVNQLKEGNPEAFKDLFIAAIGMPTLWLPLTRGAIRREAKDVEMKRNAKIIRKLLWERVPIPKAIMKYNVKLMRVLQMINLPPSPKVCKKIVRETLKAFYYSLKVYVRRL